MQAPTLHKITDVSSPATAYSTFWQNESYVGNRKFSDFSMEMDSFFLFAEEIPIEYSRQDSVLFILISLIHVYRGREINRAVMR